MSTVEDDEEVVCSAKVLDELSDTYIEGKFGILRWYSERPNGIVESLAKHVLDFRNFPVKVDSKVMVLPCNYKHIYSGVSLCSERSVFSQLVANGLLTGIQASHFGDLRSG